MHISQIVAKIVTLIGLLAYMPHTHKKYVISSLFLPTISQISKILLLEKIYIFNQVFKNKTLA